MPKMGKKRESRPQGSRIEIRRASRHGLAYQDIVPKLKARLGVFKKQIRVILGLSAWEWEKWKRVDVLPQRLEGLEINEELIKKLAKKLNKETFIKRRCDE